jgi:secondary thiamine-phosphate synthase enzyme
MIKLASIDLKTQGNAQVINITRQIEQHIRESGLAEGLVTVFCPSATSGVTTIEFEEGAVRDFQRLFDEIVAPNREYLHNLRWGDGNGHSHVRAALLGPSLSIPFANQQMLLGTWQQIIFVDFDNRARQRRLVVQMIGEPQSS